MTKILGDGQRGRSQAFAELQSYYLFDDKFGHPAKGNDKGEVEGLIGYSRRHFMVPLPVADDLNALNAQLLDGYLKRQRAVLCGQSDTIAHALAALMPLPVKPYDDSHKQNSRVSSQALVRYRTNDYSVPTQYGHQAVLVKGHRRLGQHLSGRHAENLRYRASRPCHRSGS